jgi:hypothetical protein
MPRMDHSPTPMTMCVAPWHCWLCADGAESEGVTAGVPPLHVLLAEDEADDAEATGESETTHPYSPAALLRGVHYAETQ